MLQITEYNVRLKLGLQKKHGPLPLKAHGRPHEGKNGHSPSSWKLVLRTKIF